MKKIIFLLVSFLVGTVWAQSPAVEENSFQKAYKGYQDNLTFYHQAYTEFEAAREEYYAYGTLTAKTLVFEQLLTTLLKRNAVVESYLDLLKVRLEDLDDLVGDNLLGSSVELLVNLGKEKEIYAGWNTDLAGAVSLEKLMILSGEIESGYKKQTETLIYRLLISIFVVKDRSLLGDLSDLFEPLETKINLIGGELGNGVVKLESWLEDAKAKHGRAEAILDKVEGLVFSPERKEISFSEYKNNYQEVLKAYQLIEESAYHVREIVRELRTVERLFVTPTAAEEAATSEPAACAVCGG